MHPSIYLGRMPVLNIHGRVFAYELIYRNTDDYRSIVCDNLQATARVLVNAIHYIGLEGLTQYKPALIKVDEKTIFDDFIYSVSDQYFILEILETSIISSELVDRIIHLHKKGYIFSLNHFNDEDEFLLHYKAILPFTSYIKIDIQERSQHEITSLMKRLSSLDAQIIADKVETEDEYEWAKKVGFHFFEGYYFSKPDMYIRNMIDPDSKILLDLILLLKSHASFEDIISIFNDSSYLSVNLLKFIHLHHKNSDAKIVSIDQALILLGRDKLSHWVELMLYAQGDQDEEDNSFSDLAKIAKTRAKLMQELSHLISHEHHSSFSTSAYLVGILSLSDTIFQTNYEDIFSQMDLEKSISTAIVSGQGTLGRLLTLCILIEKNDVIEIPEHLKLLHISQEQLNNAVMKAYIEE